MSGVGSGGGRKESAPGIATVPSSGDRAGGGVQTQAPYEVIPTIRVTGKGKMMAVKVQMLDDGLAIFQVQAKALGRVLFDQVCRQLSLLEADYFGLEYSDGNGTCYWLDLSKPMKDQMVLNTIRDPLLRFCVKFYPPDPGQLEEEYTRFLFCLQVKRDMAQGHLTCNDNTAALLASYVVQAESGDYAPEDYPDPSYLSAYKFVPHQDADLERLIMENHKKHVGQTPAEADLNLLETARRCELYGVKMTQAKDHEGVPLNLAIAHMGILVFQKLTRINTFSWAKIRKLSFKRRKFLVKLHPEGYVSIGGVYYKDQVEFFFDGRDECKNFWKKCVEHHGFFRCSSVKRIPRHRPKVMSRGSSFRYVGKTQKEIMDFVRGNFVKRQSFQRSQSFRQPLHSVMGSHPNVGPISHERAASVVAHPILPINDAMMAGAHSMGSISLSHGGGGRGSLGGTGSLSRRAGDASIGSGLRGSRSAHSPVSPAHTDPGGDLPDFEEREGSGRDEALIHGEPGSKRGTHQVQHHLPHHHHHYEMPETPSVATSKQTTSVTSSPQRIMTTTDDDDFSSSPRRIWRPSHPRHQQSNAVASGSGSGSTSVTAASDRDFARREPSLDHGEYDLNSGQDDRDLGFGGERSPTPPPPPPPLDEEGNDTSLTGMVDRVLSPLTSLAQETRRSLTVNGNNINNNFESGLGDLKSYTSGHEDEKPVIMTNGGVNGMTVSDRNENDIGTRQDVRKKRHASDRAYFIAKEILMTERTYKKDLEVIEVWLRDELCNSGEEPGSEDDGMPRLVLEQLFSIHDPIYDFHSALLKEIEERVAGWESNNANHHHHQVHNRLSGARIGDIFHNSMHKMTPLYLNYLNGHRDVMEGLEYALRDSPKFDQLIRDFETQKVCYLPLFAFILKPLHRLAHYQALLRRLVSHYAIDHPDMTSCRAALTMMTDLVARVGDVLPSSDNYAKLVELQREMSGFDTLVQNDRIFIREGCLQKLSRKGYQQRMFFLFSDVIVYAGRVTQPMLQFRVHGLLPLRGVMVEEADGRTAVPHSFTIYGGNRALMVAAGTAEEMRSWLQDLARAITVAREKPESAIQYLSLKSASSSEDVGVNSTSSSEKQQDGEGSWRRGSATPPPNNGNDLGKPGVKPAPAVNQRSNTSVHVCWHRNTSVSAMDLRLAANSQLSGYLLRKFKNSTGWQKLWVVFTNFCLFFYKTYQDDSPLASLPLLSYRVTTPSPQDDIVKDFVFKLQFKNHVYFFRAESEYTFTRWMEVIGNATNRTFDFTSEFLRSPSLR